MGLICEDGFMTGTKSIDSTKYSLNRVLHQAVADDALVRCQAVVYAGLLRDLSIIVMRSPVNPATDAPKYGKKFKVL